MSTVTATTRATPATTRRSWWAHETRVGRYLYPLRAMAVTAVAGAAAAVAAVVGAVALLPG